jgi:Ca2+-binding RTX toxin-like protein
MRGQASPSLRGRRETLISRLLPLLAVGFVSLVALAGSVSAGVGDGTPRADVLRGTGGSDSLKGMAGDDRLIGYRGADLLLGGPGNDLLLGGADGDRLFGDTGNDRLEGGSGDDFLGGGGGRDTLRAGPGNDRIFTRDGARDVIGCGSGRDSVSADRIDAVSEDCEVGGPSAPPPLDEPPPPPSGQSVELVDEPWICTGRVNLDLVKVTIRTVRDDAIQLRAGCTGRIGRVEVETWTADGIKVNAPPPAAHDLVIYGGTIRCHERHGGAHNDGIQVMGGERLSFRKLEINCNAGPNAQLFVAAANGGMPTDVVCEGCFLGSGAAQSLFIADSVRSGARNTLVCPGRFQAIRIDGGAQSPVNSRNTVLDGSDERCQTVP